MVDAKGGTHAWLIVLPHRSLTHGYSKREIKDTTKDRSPEGLATAKKTYTLPTGVAPPHSISWANITLWQISSPSRSREKQGKAFL
jgi:hypothetical protein